jgi:hypothetical protein
MHPAPEISIYHKIFIKEANNSNSTAKVKKWVCPPKELRQKEQDTFQF